MHGEENIYKYKYTNLAYTWKNCWILKKTWITVLQAHSIRHKEYQYDGVIAFHLYDYTFISKCTLEPIIASRKATEVRIILKLWIYFKLTFRIFLSWEQLSQVMHGISTVCYRYKTAWKSIRGFQQNWS